MEGRSIRGMIQPPLHPAHGCTFGTLKTSYFSGGSPTGDDDPQFGATFHISPGLSEKHQAATSFAGSPKHHPGGHRGSRGLDLLFRRRDFAVGVFSLFCWLEADKTGLCPYLVGSCISLTYFD